MVISAHQLTSTRERFAALAKRSQFHASREINNDLHMLVAELIGDQHVTFFDWSPSAEQDAGATAMSGTVLIVTARELIIVRYRDVDYFADQKRHNTSPTGACDIEIHSLASARSVNWAPTDIQHERVGYRAAVTVAGDGWTLSLPGEHLRDTEDRFEFVNSLRTALWDPQTPATRQGQ